MITPQQFGSAQVSILAQTPVQAARTSVVEGSTVFVTVAVFDSNGLPLIPSALRWRLDDLTTDTVVQGWQGFVTAPQQVTPLTIPAALNQLSSVSTESECFELSINVSDTMSPVNEATVTAQYDVLAAANAQPEEV